MTSTDGDMKWRFIAGRVGNDGTFAVGVPLRSMNKTVARLLLTSGVISALVLALCALIGSYAVTRAFRPLRQIEDTAAAIAKGDLTQRIPVRQADDEVTSLSQSLNSMLGRIEESFAVREASEARMRQFVADASHELRTPLATVQGYAELHRQGALATTEQADAAMERIEGESKRMTGLVEDLLVLARLDDEPVDMQGEVDLTVLAADAVADARVRAPERTIRLVGRDGPLVPTVVHGSDSRLRQVLTNVLANALAHTPEGSPVEVRLGQVEDGDGGGARSSRSSTTGPASPNPSAVGSSSVSCASIRPAAAAQAGAAGWACRSSRPSSRPIGDASASARPPAAAPRSSSESPQEFPSLHRWGVEGRPPELSLSGPRDREQPRERQQDPAVSGPATSSALAPGESARPSHRAVARRGRVRRLPLRDDEFPRRPRPATCAQARRPITEWVTMTA